MARPIKHDGGLFKRTGSKVWWMQYRDKAGQRQKEVTGVEDWNQAQQILRERLQARDNNTLPSVRRGRARSANGRVFIWRTFLNLRFARQRRTRLMSAR